MRLIILTMILGLAGCASLVRDFQERTCNYDGAFEYGANQARNRQPMNGRTLTSQCPEDTQDHPMKGYRDGYISIESRPRIEIYKDP